MSSSSPLTAIGLAVVAAQLLCVREAQAYLDPGSGSLIFQTLVAAVVGAGAALRIYWRQIRAFFSGEAPTRDEGEADTRDETVKRSGGSDA